MPYASVADLTERFGDDEIESLAQGAPAGTIDTDKVTLAIEDAESEINSYLAQRYAVPVANFPKSITAACCDIARYRLFAGQAHEDVTTRYKDRIEWLKSIAKGLVTLGVAEADSQKNSLFVATTTGGKNRLFTRDTLSDY